MPSSCEVRVETLQSGVIRIPKPLPLPPGTRLYLIHGLWGGDANFCLQMPYQTQTNTDSGGRLIIPGTATHLIHQRTGNTLILAQRHPILRSGEYNITPVGLEDIMLYQNREPNVLSTPGPFNISSISTPTEVRGISFEGFPQALDGLTTGKTAEQLEQARLGLNPEQLRQLLVCFRESVEVKLSAA